ncbi:phosphoribosylglycinamide synthetase [Streptomyces mashuensis]|uniref:Phosphoribosylglycinamide synthetase n=1 Tax=Streptomyces mashuensis TaxID=33904 RepID=A0A919B324_9ACTN|nr:ATP-grasp domain-containing protein [Streptomyces mashuensis]GHF48534.1 phosphoribosylglycinamide synthetase [Streptomyces mashuensis]
MTASTTTEPAGRILVVEAVSGGVLLTDAALELGLRVVVASADRDDRTVPDRLRDRLDALVTVETNDLDALTARVRDLHARLPLSAVFPGCDVYVPAAAHLAAGLGLTGLDVRTVDRVRDKARMREAVAAAGLHGPRFVEVDTAAGLRAAGEHTGFPCVLKPVDQSGSLHVTKVHDQRGLAAAYDRLTGDPLLDLGRPMDGRVLVEEYLAGPEYSVEGHVRRGGRTAVLAVTEKILGPEPHFAELGHVVPAALPDTAAAAVEEYVHAVVAAVGITAGPFHCELRLTAAGPALVEIGARLPGDRIPDLVRLVRGVSMPRLWLAEHLGLDPDAAGARTRPVAPCAGIHFFTAPGGTRCTHVTGLDEARRTPGVREAVLDVRPGDPVHPGLDDFRCRLGHALLTADSPAELAAVRRRVARTVRIHTHAEEHAHG